MATRAVVGEASAFPTALAAILSQPRPVIAALAARLIDRLDELDGCDDFEPEPDEPEDDSEEVTSGGATVRQIGGAP